MGNQQAAAAAAGRGSQSSRYRSCTSSENVLRGLKRHWEPLGKGGTRRGSLAQSKFGYSVEVLVRGLLLRGEVWWWGERGGWGR